MEEQLLSTASSESMNEHITCTTSAKAMRCRLIQLSIIRPMLLKKDLQNVIKDHAMHANVLHLCIAITSVVAQC